MQNTSQNSIWGFYRIYVKTTLPLPGIFLMVIDLGTSCFNSST
jgi:hypothetical protein